MFLTQCEINPQQRTAARLLAQPRSLHGAIMKAMGGNDAVEAATTDASPGSPLDGRVLWRVDRHPHACLLYVVSPVEGDFSQLAEECGFDADARWRTASYDKFLSSLSAGQRYHLRLTANPSHTVTNPETGVKKVYGHVTAAQQLKWLLDRCDNLGFTPVTTVEGEPLLDVTERSTQKARRENRQVTHARATYTGAIEVTDPVKLHHALTHGIGRGRAYGLGLATLALISD